MANNSNLNDRINQIINAATKDIVQALRLSIADEVIRAVGLTSAPRPAAAAPSAAPKAPAAAAPVAAKKKGGRKSRKGQPDAATLDKLLKTIGANPNMRSEHIRKQVALPAEIVKAALAHLRATKKVKTKGERRATSYTLA